MRTEMRLVTRLLEIDPVVVASIADLVRFRRMKREHRHRSVLGPQVLYELLTSSIELDRRCWCAFDFQLERPLL